MKQEDVKEAGVDEPWWGCAFLILTFTSIACGVFMHMQEVSYQHEVEMAEMHCDKD